MIIWSGLGILIPLVAVFGIIVGTAITGTLGHSDYGLGLGCVLAAIGNWGLWKWIYPKRPRILIDRATGQEVVLLPKHGLFFIPAKWWTWILAILAIPMMVGGAADERQTSRDSAIPGYREFKEADRLIGSKSEGDTHGDSAGARQAAARFATTMKAMTEVFFTGGSKSNLLTGGNFLTYCHDGADTIVFLCHVPSLRSYKSEETKKQLADIAWGVARRAATPIDPDHHKKLLVGLRGITSYGSIQHGESGEGAAATSLDANDKSVFYRAFAPAAPQNGK